MPLRISRANDRGAAAVARSVRHARPAVDEAPAHRSICRSRGRPRRDRRPAIILRTLERLSGQSTRQPRRAIREPSTAAETRARLFRHGARAVSSPSPPADWPRLLAGQRLPAPHRWSIERAVAAERPHRHRTERALATSRCRCPRCRGSSAEARTTAGTEPSGVREPLTPTCRARRRESGRPRRASRRAGSLHRPRRLDRRIPRTSRRAASPAARSNRSTRSPRPTRR